MRNLEKLYFNENNLRGSIKEKWFKGLKRLKLLSLSSNKIIEIEDNAFDNLIYLEKLYLNNNNLSTVREIWLKNFKELIYPLHKGLIKTV